MTTKLHAVAGALAAAALALGAAWAPPAAADTAAAYPCISYMCIEADSGAVLIEANADEVRPPASMVKMMMLLMVAEGLDEGRWAWDAPITITRKTQQVGGSQVFLAEGEVHPLGRLTLAAAVASANDATMALAEGLWGSEEAYLEAMNARAQELGMIDSKFHSVHGLPPDPGEEFDATTARDMAILAQWCVRSERIMNWVNRKELQFREGDAVKYSTNKLLWRMDDVDGLKTGYIRAAGFCLTSTAVRDGVRLISVVMGCDRLQERFDESERVLEEGFAALRRVPVWQEGLPVDVAVHVLNAKESTLTPFASADGWVVARESEVGRIELEYDLPKRLRAPVPAGAVLGKVRATVDGHLRAEADLIAQHDVTEAGWAWKLERSAEALAQR